MNDHRKPNAVAVAGGADGSAMHQLWVWICAAEEISPGFLNIERRQDAISGFVGPAPEVYSRFMYASG
jgi:hypothetical protein